MQDFLLVTLPNSEKLSVVEKGECKAVPLFLVPGAASFKTSWVDYKMITVQYCYETYTHSRALILCILKDMDNFTYMNNPIEVSGAIHMSKDTLKFFHEWIHKQDSVPLQSTVH